MDNNKQRLEEKERLTKERNKLYPELQKYAVIYYTLKEKYKDIADRLWELENQ